MLAFSTVIATVSRDGGISLLMPAQGEERRSAGFAEKLRTPVPPVLDGPGRRPAPSGVVGVCTIVICLDAPGRPAVHGLECRVKANLLIAVVLMIPGVFWIKHEASPKTAKSEQVQ